MSMKAGIIGAGLAAWASWAAAFTSPYSGMAVPGDHNGWNTTPSMVLTADNTWVCTQTLSSASGSFKFAANGGWSVFWGGNSSVFRVPAVAVAPVPAGDPLSYANFSNGLYRLLFNDQTQDFRIEWAGTPPLPIPVFTNLALVGDFNGWTPNINSRLTNHPAPQSNLWSGTVLLDANTTFQFLPNGNSNNLWGASKSTVIIAPTNGSACGKSDITLAGVSPGLYTFSLNLSNAMFSVAPASFAAVNSLTVQGSFIGTNTPPANMSRLPGTTLWESDHHITNTTSVTLGFYSGTNFFWGATNGTPLFPLPASGVLQRSATNLATVGVNAAGRYRITFNHASGDFTFRRLYTDNSQGTNINLLKNPGFEQTSEPGGGTAVNWGSFQAWPHGVANQQAAPHTGVWCGAIHGRYLPGWNNYGSFAQDVAVVTGRTYQVSAWFRATSNWSASTMQIKVEWLNATNGSAGDDAILNIPSLSTAWVKYSLEAIPPATATKAHVVFLCAGADTTGSLMYIDDAEMKTVAGRIQNFDTWGALQSYGPYSPDWSITSGKTVWNVPPGRPSAGVFISQYVEGTGKNKAIEVFNGTVSNLDLAAGNYVFQQYDNGATNPSVSMALSGTVPAGTTLVVARPAVPTNFAPDPGISSLGPQTNKFLTFNGDDVVVLRQGGAAGTVLDRVGQVGTNATGSIWSRYTQNRTLSRKPTVFTGTVGAVTAAFPLAEWNVRAGDDFSGLGMHDLTYVDPNEPYTPGGYSLIMNTNAILMSGELPGGIGDVSFWWRTESMSPLVTMSLESGPTDTGPWTTNATLAGVAASNFAYYVVAVNRPDHLYWRIRQTAGATNRFRIDEITVSEYAAIKRYEDFNSWTDPAYAIAGNYSRYGWSLVNAAIAPTSGVSASRAAYLSPLSGAILSPAYADGVGEVSFWAKSVDPNAPARLLLQVTTDGGTNWITQGTFLTSTGSTFTTWLYFTNYGAQARIVFDPAFNSGDALVDNIAVRLPALYRNQNFNGWPPRGTYTNDTYQGWLITDCIVDGQNAYEGQVARLNTATGNYIQSPYLPGGIGTLSFWTRKWATNDAAATLSVQLSPDAKTWTTLTTVSPTSIIYQQYSAYIGTTTQFFVRLLHSAGAVRVLVDDIRCGIYQPRPQVIATPGLDPATPLIDEPMQVVADVLTRYGASILSVTGYYWIANGVTNQSPMPGAVGTYRTTAIIPGQPAGTMIRYQVAVLYAGLGATSNSPGYTTNVYLTPVFTNFIATVPLGDIWINEIFYAPYGPDEPIQFEWLCTNSVPCSFTNDDYYGWSLVTNGSNHEFIELCGVAGVDLGGWTIQLAFGSAGDIAVNSNNPVYASYRIPTNTVITNLANGYGYYVLGDAELVTNAPIDLLLTNALTEPPPAFMVPVSYKDHIYDGIGVVRLLDQFGNEFYSLSYQGFAPGSDRIPQSQAFINETNSIGLSYQGDTYPDFSWEMGIPSAGEANSGQVLIPRTPATNVYAWGWHAPTQWIVPANTNLVAPFYMFDPYQAGHYDAFDIHYGYTNAAYPSAGGTLRHRLDPAGPWNSLAMGIRTGAGDAAGYGYVWATIPPYTYRRLQTVAYVIEVTPNKTGVLPVFLGYTGGVRSAVFTNLTEAQANPFRYTIPIRDVIVITNLAVSATNVTLWTDGNDPVDPLVNFQIQATTNVLTQFRYVYDANTNIVGTTTNATWGVWTVTNHTGYTNIYGEWTFNIRRYTSDVPARYYRIKPLWP